MRGLPLGLVHEVLQAAQDDDWAERGDESAVALAQVAAAEKAKVVYVYDFGDDWRHDSRGWRTARRG